MGKIIKPDTYQVLLSIYINGGEREIRTLDGVNPHTRLAGERLQPLGHFSTIYGGGGRI